MTILIDGDQLRTIPRLFGQVRLQGLSGATEIADTEVVQTLPVVPEILRRSLTPVESGGWFFGCFQNVHAAANDQQTIFDPYAAGADRFGAYPAQVDGNQLDFWILTATLVRSAGAGDLTGAQLRLGTLGTNFAQGFGRDDSGAPFSSAGAPAICQWAGGINSDVNSGLETAVELGTGKAVINLGLRIRQGLSLVFDTTSAAAVTFDLRLVVGLFAAGMGQDILR